MHKNKHPHSYREEDYTDAKKNFTARKFDFFLDLNEL